MTVGRRDRRTDRHTTAAYRLPRGKITSESTNGNVTIRVVQNYVREGDWKQEVFFSDADEKSAGTELKPRCLEDYPKWLVHRLRRPGHRRETDGRTGLADDGCVHERRER